MPSVPGYILAHTDDTIYVNLFVDSTANISLGRNVIRVVQQTEYPWDGKVRITVQPEKATAFSVCVRIPGWARNEPVPSDLYSFFRKSGEMWTLKVNGAMLVPNTERGYVRIQRRWKSGDIIELNFPMSVRRVIAHRSVEADSGKVASQRGPLVYAFEAIDNGGSVLGRILSDDLDFEKEFHTDLLGGVNILKSATVQNGLMAIPYYAWYHRGVGEMAVWLPRHMKHRSAYN